MYRKRLKRYNLIQTKSEWDSIRRGTANGYVTLKKITKAAIGIETPFEAVSIPLLESIVPQTIGKNHNMPLQIRIRSVSIFILALNQQS